MIKFAAVGFTCIDVYKNLGISYPTGNGIDLLFNLTDMVKGIEPSVVSAVGDDENGAELLKACKIRNFNTDHVSVVKNGNTAVFEMLLNGKDRVHFRAERGVMPSYKPSESDMDFIRTNDYIHTDLSWNVVDLLPDIRKKGTKIFFDFSKKYQHPDVDRVLSNIDFGLFSFEEENEEVRELLKKGCALGASVLIATFGEKGSLCYDGKEFHRQECIPAVELINTVGAGDSYGAGFMAGVLTGKSIEESMKMGAERSSFIVSMFKPYPDLSNQ